MILLYKTGEHTDIGNDHPIYLAPSLFFFTFSSIIQKRISKNTEENQLIEQAGFRRGYNQCNRINHREI